MKYFIVVFLLLSAPCYSANNNIDYYLSVNRDVVHADKSNAVFIDAYNKMQNQAFHIGYLTKDVSRGVGSNFVVGSEKYFKMNDSFSLFLGIAYLRNTNDQIGTNFNFSLGPKLKISKTCHMFLRHYSNGKKIGIGPDNKPNRGLNYLGMGCGI